MDDNEAFATLFGNFFYKNYKIGNEIPQVKKQVDFSCQENTEKFLVNSVSDNTSKTKKNAINNLVSVSEIPPKYRSVFQSFPNFNIVQSTVFEDVFYTDKSLVVCAPTGSGKTVIFELGIVRLLMLISDLGQAASKYKIIYMAPVKSLCNERYEDWKEKFTPLGAQCIQLTGDSDLENYFELQKYSIILTTPEKWDSVTRVWKNNRNLVQTVKLLLVDEVHLLNEEERGATMEAALSRMKTIESLLMGGNYNQVKTEPRLRFLAASATFLNVEDVCEWLSLKNSKGASYKFSEDMRPVHLKKVVLGYPCPDTCSEFRFDLMLSYKLNNVINMYSENKPTLVFCATRKSVVQTATILSKATNFVMNSMHKQKLIEGANTVHDNKLRECILNGIGFHHAGLSFPDRKLIEEMFLICQIQVLISTSTLAMGVNFPAHLVIIKSTYQYAGGCYKEYSDTQMLQMIGRAGRPQFDSTATAVIMTKSSLKEKYESIISGKQLVESSLHKHIVEHLNAEIVLGTITDVSIAMEWLKATYLYQRVFKNPKHYGMNMELSKEKIERKLQDMCLIELNGLRKYKLICMDNDSFNVKPTDTGRLMARYYLSFETMKSFCTLSGKESLFELLSLVSASKEFDDIQLRVSEKKLLNELNKSKNTTLRFPLPGKIKTKAMKINCLVQATFGCLPISEPVFNQDISKIFRNGIRISQCLAELLVLGNKGFSVLYNAKLLAKCFKARLWENTKHVSRQLDKIGVTLSTLLVNAGLTTFESLLKTNPRDIELILNRNPPFGTYILDNVKNLPQYEVQAEQIFAGKSELTCISVTIYLKNINDLLERKAAKENHGCCLLIGDADNNILLNKYIKDFELLQSGQWSKKFEVARARKGDEINIHVISDSYVGLDVYQCFQIEYHSKQKLSSTEKESKNFAKKHEVRLAEDKRSCIHKCLNKATCAHQCCTSGVKISAKKSVENFLDKLNCKMNSFPSKKVKIDRSECRRDLTRKLDFPLLSNNPVKIIYDDDTEKIEKCVTPTLDEMWNDEKNMNDFWEDVFETKPNDAVEPMKEEIDLSDKVYFDLNSEDVIVSRTTDKVFDTENIIPNNNDLQSVAATDTNPMFPQQNIRNFNCDSLATPIESPKEKESRKIWTLEDQRDPAKQEELFMMCLNYLSNY